MTFRFLKMNLENNIKANELVSRQKLHSSLKAEKSEVQSQR